MALSEAQATFVEQIEQKLLASITRQRASPLDDLTPDETQQLEDLWVEHESVADAMSGRLQNAAQDHGYKTGAIRKLVMWPMQQRAKTRRADAKKTQKAIVDDSAERTRLQMLNKFESTDHLLERFNPQFVHTFLGPRDVVVRMKDLVSWAPDSFCALHNEPVKSAKIKGDEIVEVPRPAGEVWLNHSGRTLALGGVVCDPEKPSGLIRSGINSDHFQLNTWQGRQLEPAPGDWSPMAEVLDNLFPEKQMREWALLWLARTVQLPWLLAETALVLTGPHGAGKSTLGVFLRKVFGPRHCGIYSKADQVFGRFNEHLRDLVVLIAEEAFFHGDPRNFEKLKDMITNEQLIIEIKRGAVFPVINRLSPIIISNDEFVVRTMMGDRRYAVSKALLWKQNDNDYWSDFHHKMDNGGWAAFLDHLLKLDLSTFKHRYPPETKALQEQRHYTSETSGEAWLHDVLNRGFWVRSTHGHEHQMHRWHDQVGRQWLALSQRQWVHDHGFGGRQILNSRRIGDLMRKLTGQLKPSRLTHPMVAENRIDEGGVRTQHREEGWRLPTLSETRQLFEEMMGEGVTWDDTILTSEDQISDGEQGQFNYPDEPDEPNEPE